MKNSKTYSLKSKLSFLISLIVLLTVALISFSSNIIIKGQFNNYINKQNMQRIQGIVKSLGQQYNFETKTWDVDFIHTIGMSALNEGYIIKVSDINNKTVWDAQAHDMSQCAEIMKDISDRMQEKFPQIHGEFTSEIFQLSKNDMLVGNVAIEYYGPFFLSENDFQFLHALNTALIIIGVVALGTSILVGFLMARQLSHPLLKTVDTAKQISDGNYSARIEGKTNTKEIEKLISSINNLAISLESQEKLRKQLTEDVSHELRTSIAIVQSHLEAMIEGLWEPTAERLQSLNDEIRKIGDLVNELEKLAKIDSDNLKLNKEKFNLTQLLMRIIKSFEMKLKDKGLKVILNDVEIFPDGSKVGADSLAEIFVLADEEKISRAIVNLLSNALKYTDSDGCLIFCVTEGKNYVSFSIKDTGIGISEEDLPFIFERFYRADKSRNRKTGGLGIGLAIVKSIVEAHGGTVRVESSLGEGSLFEVRLIK